MTRPPSTDARRPMARHRAARPMFMLLAALAVGACGGGGGSGPTPEPQPANPSAIASAQPGEVLDYVKRKLAVRGPQGSLAMTLDQPAWLDTAVTASGAVSRSGTVVQEAGVDEDDLIKTDGRRVYTLQPLQARGGDASVFARLGIHTLGAGGRPTEAGHLLLTGVEAGWNSTRGLLLADDLPRLAVVAESSADPVAWPDCPPDMACITALLPYRPQTPRVQLQLVDATRADQPTVPERLLIDGRLIGTRQIGRMLYVVATHAPSFAFDLLPTTANAAERGAALDRLSLADVLPKISINGGPRQPLVAETDCWIQPANASTQIALTTITAIDLGSPTWARSSRCFVGGTEALYMSSASLYLATSRSDIQTLGDRIAFAPEARTDIHKFAVSGASVAYRGSGSVQGHLGWDREKSSYRLSEHNGDLRVLSFTGQFGWLAVEDAARQAPSPATLSVLREQAADGSLQTLATLPNAQRPAALGKPGEQVYAVRFVGDRGYLVTFRQVDPLYVLDLSDPANPRAAGVLEVPGFSDWLFPLDGGLLFGVGKDADATGRQLGVKVALFDVRDAANPRLLDSRRYGQPGSSTGLDYSAHGLAQLTEGSRTRLALPMLLAQGPLVPPALSLQRFEVDSSTRSLVDKPAIELGLGWVDLGSARSLLLGGQLHHLRDGALQTWDW